MELAVRQQVLQLAGAAVEQRPTPPTAMSEVANSLCLRAGKRAGSDAGQAGASVSSVPLHLEALLYHLSSCDTASVPRDEQLGIENTPLSSSLTAHGGHRLAMVSFQEGSEPRDRTGRALPVDAKQVERTAEAWEKRCRDERHCTEPPTPSSDETCISHGWEREPLRAEELVVRTGKQHDGSGETGEVKTLHHVSAESLDEQGTPIRDEGIITYSAALERAVRWNTAAARYPLARASGEKALRAADFAKRLVRSAWGWPCGIWNIRRRSASRGDTDGATATAKNMW